MTSTLLTAAEVIALLDLKPHPEGGHFKETFRDAHTVMTGEGADSQRSASTAIYFLLAEGEISHWHRVDAAEVWHWYAGDALKLGMKAEADSPTQTVTLGPDLSAGERPQAVVPARIWQNAQTCGDWTLVGCTVAPGFQFSGFELEAR